MADDAILRIEFSDGGAGGSSASPGSGSGAGQPPFVTPVGAATYVFHQAGTFVFHQTGAGAGGAGPRRRGGGTGGGAAGAQAAARAIGTVGQAAGVAGQAGAALAGNNFAGVVASATGAVAQLASALGPAGVVVAALATAAGTAVGAVNRLVDAFVSRARELEPYSGELAAAGARAQVRSIGADIREAQRLGPGLARLEDAQSELAVTLRELLLPIKEFVVEKLVGLLEGINDLLTTYGDNVVIATRSLASILEILFQLNSLNFVGAWATLKQMPDRIAEALEKKKQLDEVYSLWREWQKLADPANQPDFGARNVRDQVQGGALNIPAFNGL